MQGNFATGSPDIAFEVVSSDRADRLQFKIDGYLERGSKAVCCIYPGQKNIFVWMRDQSFVFRNGAQLEFPTILSGFSATALRNLRIRRVKPPLWNQPLLRDGSLQAGKQHGGVAGPLSAPIGTSGSNACREEDSRL